jgi:hypothetical protein
MRIGAWRAAARCANTAGGMRPIDLCGRRSNVHPHSRCPVEREHVADVETYDLRETQAGAEGKGDDGVVADVPGSRVKDQALLVGRQRGGGGSQGERCRRSRASPGRFFWENAGGLCWLSFLSSPFGARYLYPYILAGGIGEGIRRERRALERAG